MKNFEEDKSATPEELDTIVRRGGADALGAFNILTAQANGGDKTSRKIVNALDIAFTQGEIKFPSPETKALRRKGFLEQLSDLVPQKGLLPPDKY